MAKVTFRKGNLASLPSQKTEGTLYVTVDERAIWFDVDGSTRIRLGDFQTVKSISDLPKDGANETALYYITDSNILAKWEPGTGDPGTPEATGKWVQINPDRGATGVEITDTGLTGITGSYDDTSRKIKITIPNKLLKEEDLDTKIGEIGVADVKTYVDNAGDEIGQRIDGVETTANNAKTAIEKLNGEESVEGSVAKTVKDAIGELDTVYAKASHEHTTEQISDLDEKLGTKAEASEFTALTSKVTSIEKVVGQSASDGLQKDVADLKDKVGNITGAMHFKGKATEDPTTMETLDEYKPGDVVYWNEKEYVFIDETESEGEKKFVELGDTSDVVKRLTTVEDWKTTTDSTIKSLGTTYEKAGAVAQAKTDLIGTDEDVASNDTIKGAKKYADDAITALNIEDYAKTADLDGYLKTEELDTHLSDYAKTEDLASYAQKTELESYAKAADLEWGTF